MELAKHAEKDLLETRLHRRGYVVMSFFKRRRRVALGAETRSDV